MRTLVDGQMQGDDTVATMDGREVLHIVAGLGVGLAIPSVAVAGGLGELACDSVVDGQVQRDGAVAAMDGLEVLCIVAGLGVCLAVPSVAIAHGGVEFGGI